MKKHLAALVALTTLASAGVAASGVASADSAQADPAAAGVAPAGIVTCGTGPGFGAGTVNACIIENNPVAWDVGIWGEDDSQGGTGVEGYAADGYGVVGSGGTGVKGLSSGQSIGQFDTLAGAAVLGQSQSQWTIGVAGNGWPDGTSPAVYGVNGNYAVQGDGTPYSTIGVYGNSTGNYGVYGVSGTNVAVEGDSTSSDGVHGTSNSYNGVHGESETGTGVFGESWATSGTPNGVTGQSHTAGGSGVWGNNKAGGNGVAGSTNGSGGNGVYGTNSGGGNGVSGSTTSGNGVNGQATTGYEVNGSSTSGDGVVGTGAVAGVWGKTTGSTQTAIGVYGESGSGTSFAGYFVGPVYVNGSFGYSSDERLKKNVQPLEGALNQLLQLKGVTFEWRDPDGHGRTTGTQRGFIAQEVEKFFPGWVGVDRDGFRTLDTRQVEALEVESIRTLKDRAEKAEAKLATVEGRLSALENDRNPARAGLVSSPASGWAFGGLALVSSIIIARRRRPDDRS